ncbi:MAG: pyruvate kinase, partial [Bacteroidia bacterium]|nr:pyruvate kinase [Bacteroidia bacterium]
MEPFFSRTKIICTMGPACANRKTLMELAKIGLDVCRINCSHANHEIHQQTIDLIRTINDEEGLNLPILLDLQGPKIRIGKLDEPFPIQPGDLIQLSTSVKQRTGHILPMEYETFAQDVNPGDIILVDDGKIELKVVETNRKDTVTLEVIVGEQILSRKGVNLPNVHVSLPSLSEKDLEDLEFGIRNNVEWIALSFVRKA